MEKGTKVLTIDFTDDESVKAAVLVLDQELEIRARTRDELENLQNIVATARQRIAQSLQDCRATQHKLLRKSVAQAIGLKERVPKSIEIFIEPLEITPVFDSVDTLVVLKMHSNAETVAAVGKDADKKKK